MIVQSFDPGVGRASVTVAEALAGQFSWKGPFVVDTSCHQDLIVASCLHKDLEEAHELS